MKLLDFDYASARVPQVQTHSVVFIWVTGAK